jgi:hypothetical protein
MRTLVISFILFCNFCYAQNNKVFAVLNELENKQELLLSEKKILAEIYFLMNRCEDAQKKIINLKEISEDIFCYCKGSPCTIDYFDFKNKIQNNNFDTNQILKLYSNLSDKYKNEAKYFIVKKIRQKLLLNNRLTLDEEKLEKEWSTALERLKN